MVQYKIGERTLFNFFFDFTCYFTPSYYVFSMAKISLKCIGSILWTMVEFLHPRVTKETRSMVEVIIFCLYHVMRILFVISTHETLFKHMESKNATINHLILSLEIMVDGAIFLT